MAKCISCGKTLLVSKIKLADAEICPKCFNNLGFKDFKVTSTLYKWDEIKNGYDEYRRIENEAYWNGQYMQESEEFGLSFSQSKALNKIKATKMEKQILGAIRQVLFDEDCDADLLSPALGHNGSVLLMIDGVVAIEYKAEDKVKWIRLPNESEEKIKIGGPARMNSLGSRLVKAYKAAIE